MSRPVVVVGAGLVGCVLATLFTRRGLNVVVYERNADPRGSGDDPTRPSINLTLCDRGLLGLAEAGLLDAVRPMLTPAHGRMVHLSSGQLVFQQYGEEQDAIHSVNRRELNIALLEEAEQRGVVVRFERRCVDCDLDEVSVKFAAPDGHVETVSAACVFGADGAGSALRTVLSASGRIAQTLRLARTAYKTLKTFPHIDGWVPHAIHLWPRGESMAVALPNRDGSFSVGLHLPLSGPSSFEALSDERSMYRFLGDTFPDLLPRLDRSSADLYWQRPNKMVTVGCRPWNVAGKLLLLGDAAHALLPHYGQGANAGFEDCRTLDGLVERMGCDWEAVLAAFAASRPDDTDAIADLCWDHVHELHETVGDDQFTRRLHMERLLRRHFPRRIVPLYQMIAFSQIPYGQVRVRNLAQRRLIDDLLVVAHGDVDNVDDHLFDSVRDRVERELPAIAE